MKVVKTYGYASENPFARRYEDGSIFTECYWFEVRDDASNVLCLCYDEESAVMVVEKLEKAWKYDSLAK